MVGLLQPLIISFTN